MTAGRPEVAPTIASIGGTMDGTQSVAADARHSSTMRNAHNYLKLYKHCKESSNEVAGRQSQIHCTARHYLLSIN